MSTLIRKIIIAMVLALVGVGAEAQVFQDCIGQAPGCLDPSFGGGWVVTDLPLGTSPPKDSAIRDVAIQNVGEAQRIVAVGYGDYMVRYMMDGSLDTCFGDPVFCQAGAVKLPIHMVEAVAIQSDNYIVAVSNLSGKTLQMALVRYRPDGIPDASFGNNGLLIVPLNSKPMQSSAAYDVALQSDGKIVLVGCYANSLAVVRLNADGKLDTSFASGGRFIGTQIGCLLPALALQPVPVVVNGLQIVDQMIVIASSARPAYKGKVAPPSYNALLRLTSKGVVDTSFGTGGLVMTDYLGYGGKYNDLAVDAEGRLVAVGQANTGSLWSDCCQLAVARYDIRGNLDLTFNNTGKLLRAVQDAWVYGDAVAIQADGKIRVAGAIDPNDSTLYGRAAIWRFNADGTSDTNFGNLGVVDSNVVGTGGGASAFAQQMDGKFIVGGCRHAPTGVNSFALARYFE